MFCKWHIWVCYLSQVCSRYVRGPFWLWSLGLDILSWRHEHRGGLGTDDNNGVLLAPSTTGSQHSDPPPRDKGALSLRSVLRWKSTLKQKSHILMILDSIFIQHQTITSMFTSPLNLQLTKKRLNNVLYFVLNSSFCFRLYSAVYQWYYRENLIFSTCWQKT